MEWISVKDRLPEIPENKPQYSRYVKVIGCWGEQWAEFEYEEAVVRGNTVRRFKWNGRINTFPITHWAIPNLPQTNPNETSKD